MVTKKQAEAEVVEDVPVEEPVVAPEESPEEPEIAVEEQPDEVPAEPEPSRGWTPGPPVLPAPEGDPLEELTVVVGDGGATLTVNAKQFALTRDDVAQARRQFDVVHFALN